MCITKNSADSRKSSRPRSSRADGSTRNSSGGHRLWAKSLMNYWFFDQQRTVLKSAAAKSQLKCNHRAYLMCVIATRPAPLYTVLHSSTWLQLRLLFRLHAHNSIYHYRSLCGCLSGAQARHTRAQSHFILIAKRGAKKYALPVLKNWLLRK